MGVYVLAVAARTSLGVSGVEAMSRFGIDATGLALFSALQIGVYGASQIPVGVALDRFGPRRLLAIGAVMVALAQTAMAFAPGLRWAMAARVLLGVGDATAFVSVIRLVNAWFPPGSVPLFSQLTSILGMLGQIISSWPFLGLLHAAGWEPAFLSMSGAGLAVALLALAAVVDSPGARPRGRRSAGEAGSFAEVLVSPWTWLGFFSHLSGGVPAMTFALLWGVPFMTLGLGASAGAAANVLVVYTAVNMLLGPLVGRLTGLRPRVRIPFVLVCLLLAAGTWTWILLQRDPAPLGAMLVLAVVLSGSNVASTVAFDFVRQGTPAPRLGTATAAANTGGFSGALLAVGGIGIALDALSGGGAYDWGAFRLAMRLQLPILLLGGIGVVASALAARRTPQWARPAYLED